MIIGTGNDLVDISRIEKMLEDHGERFLERCFTAGEKDYARQRKSDTGGNTFATSLAKRFAAKEACVKALGCGFSGGIAMTDIGVANDAQGRPQLVLSGAAYERLETLIPMGKEAHLHLALSDEKSYAIAHVIIEAR